MNNQQEEIIKILIDKGNKLLNGLFKRIDFFPRRNKISELSDEEINKANDLLNDLKRFPHAFVLACIMDRQIPAERAWIIPYKISKEINGFNFKKLLGLSLSEIKEMFNRKKLHRFNDEMATNFYLGIKRIHEEYNDNASNIWKDNQRSATIVRRFLEFRGVGVKIATMAANILAREFKIPMKDHICIDISPDVHVKRVFKRLGFISKDASNDELIYAARELNPEYPGIFDLPCWEIGRNWCKPSKPDCNNCYLNKYCPKEGIRL